MKYKFYIDKVFIEDENKKYYEEDDDSALWEGKVTDILFDILEKNGNGPGLTDDDTSLEYYIVNIEVDNNKKMPAGKLPAWVEYWEMEED